MQQPLISVIIPTKNGEKTIERCLTSLFSQTVADQTEVIIIDSGSTDKTLDIARRFPVKIHQIPPEEFSHSGTRNLGVNLAGGRFVLMTVQDAWLSAPDILEKALKHFADPQVMAVGCRQAVPHLPEANPLQWFRPQNKPQKIVLQYNRDQFNSLSGEELWQKVRLDDVCAVYRKSALQQLPFPAVSFGEDMLWAIEALRRGWKIILDQSLIVWHYHHYTGKKRFLSRKRLENRLEETFTGKPAKSNKISFTEFLRQTVRIFYLTLLKPGFVPDRKLYWLWYNLRLLWWKTFSLLRFEEKNAKFDKN